MLLNKLVKNINCTMYRSYNVYDVSIDVCLDGNAILIVLKLFFFSYFLHYEAILNWHIYGPFSKTVIHLFICVSFFLQCHYNAIKSYHLFQSLDNFLQGEVVR